MKDLTKEEALEKLEHIYHKTRVTMGFYVPFEIVAALLNKPQQMISYDNRKSFSETPVDDNGKHF